MKWTVSYDPRWTTDRKPYLVEPKVNCFSFCRKSAKGLECFMWKVPFVVLTPKAEEKLREYEITREAHLSQLSISKYENGS
jgi:hypothetical protein